MIAEALNEWFSRTADHQRRWSGTFIGRTIKRNLKSLGHWKCAKRGNPAKGRAAQQGGEL